MSHFHNWFLKQRVTQAQMDRSQDHVLQGLGMFISRGFGQEEGLSNLRGGSQPGSIVNGGEVVEAGTPDKTIRGNYLIALVASEDPGSAFTPPTSYDDGNEVPVLAVHGTPGLSTGYDAWTHDFTTIIAAITSGQFVKCRVYGVMQRVESEDFTDGDGSAIKFLREVDIAIEVDVGTEAASAGAAALPTIREDGRSVHICTIESLTDTTTTIVDADINNRDRLYNGLTTLGGGPDEGLSVGRRAISWRSKVDDDFSVATATESERVITGTHNQSYAGIISEISSMKVLPGTWTGFWGFEADSDHTSLSPTRRKGRRRDYVIARMEFAVRDASNNVPSGATGAYHIVPLGMSTAADLAGLKENTVDFRYQVRNDTGATIFVTCMVTMITIDNRNPKLWSLGSLT